MCTHPLSLHHPDPHTHSGVIISVPAFINFNLTGEGLVHCINVATPKLILYESDLTSSISEISSTLQTKIPQIKFVRWVDRFTKGGSLGEKEESIQGEVRLDEGTLSQMSDKRLSDKYRKGITWQSPAVYIYTS